MPQKIPRIADIGIGRILPPGLSARLQILPDKAARNGQQRPQECHAIAEFTTRCHASEACKARTAETAMQDRFRLIVGRMGNDD